MAISLQSKLDFWISHNKNVLFKGKHGVGKSAIVKDAFERHNLNWLYFSASTMDPWVDFVGVPKEKSENPLPECFEIIKQLTKISPQLALEWVENNWKVSNESAKKIIRHVENHENGLTYLDLVRPKNIASGNVEAIFFDEFNRSPKKVRNAVMELIQFKSINGMSFPNLRMIWAAINPDDEDETYDVEKLDPAQADRYHIIVEMEYKPDQEWFQQRYGEQMATAAIQWWQELDHKEKDLVSPRRLQYALDYYMEKGNIRDVLPVSSNCGKLINSIKNGPISKQLADLMTSKNEEQTKIFMQNENNFTAAKKFILQSPTMMGYFTPHFPKEKIASLMSEDEKFFTYILKNQQEIPYYKAICKDILAANANYNLCKKIKRFNTEKNAQIVDVPHKFKKTDSADLKKFLGTMSTEDSIDCLY